MSIIYKSNHSQEYKYQAYVVIFVAFMFFFLPLWGALVLLVLGISLIAALFFGTEKNFLILTDRITYKESKNFAFKEHSILFDKETVFYFLIADTLTELIVEHRGTRKIFGLANIGDEKWELAYLLNTLLENGYMINLKYGSMFYGDVNDMLNKYNIKIDRHHYLSFQK
jgi:Zn-dependent protease with chaperone function